MTAWMEDNATKQEAFVDFYWVEPVRLTRPKTSAFNERDPIEQVGVEFCVRHTDCGSFCPTKSSEKR